MVSNGPVNKPSGNEGGRPFFNLSADDVREIQGLADRACRAAAQGDLVQSETSAVAVLRAVRLYPLTDYPHYLDPSEGITQFVPESIHPFIGRVLAIEAVRVLGRGDCAGAYSLASAGAELAPASLDVLTTLRNVVRANVSHRIADPAVAFMQLDRLAGAGIRYLEAAYEIKEGHAPLNLIATGERHRLRAQREIEGVVRDHIAAAESVSWHAEVARSLYLRGAQIGLAGLPLVGLPDVMAGLTDLYRHNEPVEHELGPAVAHGTAALLESIGWAYRGAERPPFAFVVFALAARLDPTRSALHDGLIAARETLLHALRPDAGADAEVARGLAAWNAYRTREISLGWNFGARGNELFAEVFYRVRDLEVFTLELARAAAHDYAIIDQGGAIAARLYVSAVPEILAALQNPDVPSPVVLAEALRARTLLRYIESQNTIPREVSKPAHRQAADLQEMIARIEPSLPADAIPRAEAFFRVIRTQHSA
jgi:hypothetical protein